ncbi:MAG TPA: polyphosphate kinase 1 [Gemmatimonadales bacterium]|nr:polyphosphate kinase 1 [Gemmatimonadales bacterium]
MTDVALPASVAVTPATPSPTVELGQPQFYINRELSWLEFNRRVLHEAEDVRSPLLERLKFLGIFSSNLDEFFQIRVAGLKDQQAAGYSERSPDGLTPEEQLRQIAAVVRGQVDDHARCLHAEVLPALAFQGVAVLDIEQVTPEERRQLDRYFQANVFPVLTPLAVDPAHPFPYISNLSLSLAVALRGADGEEHFARVKVPKILPRWVRVGEGWRYLPLEQLITANIEALFPGIEILGCHPFRITRNTDFEVDHDEAEDLLSTVQEEVRNRRFGAVVRLEVSPGLGQAIRDVLLAEFNAAQASLSAPLGADDVYEVPGLLDTADLLALAAQVDLPALKDPPHHPATPARLAGGRNIFEAIREGDILVHHPYESFTSSVERFIQTAVDDPDVVALKLTLYRTGGDSSIARLLAQAAERGKQVAVLIELQARFDEENNIRWAQRLEDVGVHVSYGVAGLKTHAKIMLVVRREGDAMRRYVHLGTGNYHPRTARLYTDFGLFTADPDLGADLTDLFNVLTGFAAPTEYRKLIVAPRGMRERFIAMIRREAEHARAGRPARIMAKMNALVDAPIIQALYEASQAGVEIDLIVRGICCLRPGIPGTSEHIRVISIIGRFLEHSRAFYFLNAGAEEVYIGSADWMPRNLDRRIEAVVPIGDPVHRQTLRDLLEFMWQDNRQAWDLTADGRYTQRHPETPDAERATHRMLMESYRESGRASGAVSGER